jgi:hypothetical protein
MKTSLSRSFGSRLCPALLMPIDERGRPDTPEERRSRAFRERLTVTGLAWALILIVLALVLVSMALRMFS